MPNDDELLEVQEQDGWPICQGCKQRVDPTVCWCGEPPEAVHDGHHFRPHGCECNMVPMDELLKALDPDADTSPGHLRLTLGDWFEQAIILECLCGHNPGKVLDDIAEYLARLAVVEIRWCFDLDDVPVEEWCIGCVQHGESEDTRTWTPLFKTADGRWIWHRNELLPAYIKVIAWKPQPELPTRVELDCGA